VGVFSHAATAADAEDKTLPLATNQYAICRNVGGQKRAGQEGCEKSRPTPVLYLRTFQPGTSCYSKYGIMALLDVATGVVFIVDAFSTSDNFLLLCITHTYFSPVSLNNTVNPPRSISPLLQYKILSEYIPHTLFLSCFSTKHYPSTSPTLYFSPVSVQNIIHPQRSISLLFQYTKLYIRHALFLSCFNTQYCTSPTLYFYPVSVQNTVYHPRSISLLFQYKTRYNTHAKYLSSFITRHCISPTLYFPSV